MPGRATIPAPKSRLPPTDSLGVAAPSLPPGNCHSCSLHSERQQKYRGPPLSRQLRSHSRAAPPPNSPGQALLGRSHADREWVRHQGEAAALAFPSHVPGWAPGRDQATPLTNSAEPPSPRRGTGNFPGHPPVRAGAGSVLLHQPARAHKHTTKTRV